MLKKRAAGVKWFREHPEMFIVGIVNSSCSQFFFKGRLVFITDGIQ